MKKLILVLILFLSLGCNAAMTRGIINGYNAGRYGHPIPPPQPLPASINPCRPYSYPVTTYGSAINHRTGQTIFYNSTSY